VLEEMRKIVYWDITLLFCQNNLSLSSFLLAFLLASHPILLAIKHRPYVTLLDLFIFITPLPHKGKKHAVTLAVLVLRHPFYLYSNQNKQRSFIWRAECGQKEKIYKAEQPTLSEQE
jgi:hypothetical protein